MRNALLLLVVVLGTGCPPNQTTCGPATCQGCCSADGTCHTGFNDATCGKNGTGCADCTSAAASCAPSHVCLVGGGAGGGSGGQSVGVADQQLISGSRLKAVRFIAADGAQAPYGSVFWDNQLQIACAPSTGAYAYAYASYYQLFVQNDLGKARCYPSMLAGDFGLSILFGGVAFRDPACTQPLTYGLQSFYAQLIGRASGPPSPMGIFNPANVKYGVRQVDGGSLAGQLTRATLHTGTIYTPQSDGGCAPSQHDGGYEYYRLGADVPESEFVDMTVTIDP